MAKSALYTVNTGAQSVDVDGTIALGTAVRRFGDCVNLNGNGIIVNGQGYYDISASITLNPTVAGTVTVTLLRDNVVVGGATASGTAAAGNPVNLSIGAIIRQLGCPCAAGSTLTLQLTGGAATVTNVAVKVVKL